MPRRAPDATPKVSHRPVPRLLLTVEEAGKALGYESSTAHRLANEGILPTVRPFGMKGRRVRLCDLEALVHALQPVGR